MNKESGEKASSPDRVYPAGDCSHFVLHALSFSPHAVLNRQAACILSHKVITAPLGLLFFPLLLFLSLSQSFSSLSPVFPPPFSLTVLLALPVSHSLSPPPHTGNPFQVPLLGVRENPGLGSIIPLEPANAPQNTAVHTHICLL